MSAMDAPRSRQIVIAGAGIAGLTAAIAFARKGFSVQVYEQAPAMQEAGAGLQLSPNATRILAALGALEHLTPAAVAPERIDMRGARRQNLLGSLPLGAAAEARWKAPYLVAHRADLQSALLARARRDPDIKISTGARIADAALHPRGATVSIDRKGRIDEVSCLLLVGADGVHSSVRGLGGGAPTDRPSGHVAWRSTVRRESRFGRELAGTIPEDAVTVFLNPRFHLVAYPVRAGAAVNLVVVTKAAAKEPAAGEPAHAALAAAMRGLRGPLAEMPEQAGPWTQWPIFEVDERISWTGEKGAALIGDAAHAMTPFAAQGAAMGIEDAVVLAELVAAQPADVPAALAKYEEIRRPRVKRVIARGRFNQRVWHAGGLTALGRNLVMRMRGGGLAADLDWLYGHDALGEAKAMLEKQTGRAKAAG
jgi:salicylate hydroxylase